MGAIVLTKADKALIYGILILAFIIFVRGYFQKNNMSAGKAVIWSKGQVVAEVDLDIVDNKVIPIEGSLGASQARVVDGSIQMLSSPCKDKMCVKQGLIKNSGQSIICVPNEVSISIEKKGDIDEITR
jgi:hypothetical protein